MHEFNDPGCRASHPPPTWLNRQRLLMAMLCLLLWPALATSSDKRERENTIDAASMAVVQIRAGNSTGSGVLVNDSSLIYTNRHVVEGHYTVDVHALWSLTEAARPAFRAELMGYSNDYDFAVLRITEDKDGNPVDSPQTWLEQRAGLRPHLAMAPAGLVLRRGEAVSLFGYPGIGDNELIKTTGIIAAVQQEAIEGISQPVWYRTNADMSPGNSGGAATNQRGELIGLPTWVRTESRTMGRLGNVLSINVIQSIMDREALETSWDDYRSSGLAYSGDGLDYGLEPHFGMVRLQPGFMPDPHQIQLVSGGSVDLSQLQDEFWGFAAEAPDYRLHWHGEDSELRIFFQANEPGADTVLVVNLPDGTWRFNDDADGQTLNPMIRIGEAPPGQYDIWVGSFDEDAFLAGTLSISELAIGPWTDAPEAGTGLNLFLPANFGTVERAGRRGAEPLRQDIISGGPVSVAPLALGPDCIGFASEAPDLRLHWSGDSDRLEIRFDAAEAGADTVLLINQPDGSWVCNDDAEPGQLNPRLIIEAPRTGQYDIWVASFSRHQFESGTLIISE